MARPKKAAISLGSVEECTRAMGELAIAQADKKVAQANAARDVAEASARHEAALDDAKRREKDLLVALQTYYYGHLDELETDGRKCFDLVNGRMGRRDGVEKVEPLNKGWTWEAIAIKVRALWEGRFFHPPKAPELDREALRALTDEQLAAAGLKRSRGESFYAEPLAPKGE